MKKFNAVLSLFLLISFYVSAQAPVMQFEKTTHDFGAIKEDGGAKKHRFTFTNKGNAPLVISAVNASCGCTTPGWSKEPVMPGKTGYVEAEYNPMGRPGAFNKSLTVTSNANPAVTVLYIKGEVSPKVLTAADQYPDKLGSIRLASKYLNMGRVGTKAPATKTFKVYNDGDKAITFNDIAPAQKHIRMSVQPKVLQPKATGEIKVTFDGKMKNDYGYVNEAVEITTAGDANNKKQLFVVATIEDSPAKLTPAEAAKAPKISFNKTMHEFGKIKQGEVVNTEFVFTNTGKEELKINKTKASCGCTASNPEKTVLKPGESSKIKVTFNATGKKGSQNQSVTIYSNDPANPTQVISIKADVGA
jgi:uncharacterized cupredoxin-like copper-binding protein